ncbi:MAG: hypothetical protein KDA88_15915 [Planctomycetaceae bacterium]|nr:hypothetical protein [Planctomycetaceae bacterium]MCB9949482.1 hypothetical protein [Planctomycetaceae bacterium]
MAKKRRTLIGKQAVEGGTTVVFGKEQEANDFIKVPRSLIRMARYLGEPKWSELGLKPCHVMLLLTLAARKFKTDPIRAYWEELAEDLGVAKDTVRKWAYKLQKKGLLEILQHKGRKDHAVGYKNDRNEFVLNGFMQVHDVAWQARRKDRQDRKNSEEDDVQ